MCKSDGHLQRRSLKLRVTDLADVCDEMWWEHHSEPIRCCLWLGVWFWLERLRCCRWICESEGPWCPPHHWTSASRTDPSTRSDTAWGEREEKVGYFEQKEESIGDGVTHLCQLRVFKLLQLPQKAQVGPRTRPGRPHRRQRLHPTTARHRHDVGHHQGHTAGHACHTESTLR